MNADAFGGTMPIQDTKRKRMQIRAKLENAKKRRRPDYDFDELKPCKQQKKNSNEAKRFRATGPDKLEKLISSNIRTAREFIRLF
jgi:hypothetical protein